MDISLPPGFASLEPYVARFCAASTADRAALRGALSAEEREAFYTATKESIGPALDLLDRKPLDRLDPAERRLLGLCLSFAHIALAVELQGPDEARHAEMREHMRITRSPADNLV